MSVYPKVSRLAAWSKKVQMVQLSATRCSCITIVWVSPVSFTAITICVASQWVFIVVNIYFVIDSVQKLLDTPSYTLLDWRRDEEIRRDLRNNRALQEQAGENTCSECLTTFLLELHAITSQEDTMQLTDWWRDGRSKFNGVGMGQNGLILVFNDYGKNGSIQNHIFLYSLPPWHCLVISLINTK
jgi:hypothetical protein